MSAKLINECFFTAIKGVESDSVDLIITDPPYKVTSRGGYTSAGGMMLDSDVRKGNVFKNNNIKISDWLHHLYDKLKESGHCYVMCNNKNLHSFLSEVEKSKFKLVKTMIWAKDNKIMSQAYMSQIEFVLFLRKGKFKKINNCGTSDLLSFKNVRDKLHPSEKPVDLLECLIENSSNQGDLVFDPFFGSGSCAIACQNKEREFIGFEVDPEFYEIAKERLITK